MAIRAHDASNICTFFTRKFFSSYPFPKVQFYLLGDSIGLSKGQFVDPLSKAESPDPLDRVRFWTVRRRRGLPENIGALLALAF